MLISVETFYILDNLLDMVSEMSWFHKVNPRINYHARSICMYINYLWVSLPMCRTDKEVQPIFNAANNIKNE